MENQRIEKVEHVIFISKYKQENSSIDYSVKVNIIIPHLIAMFLTFNRKIFKKVVNVYGYFSLKHANYALIFVVTFQCYLKDRLLWPFRRSFREIRILHMQ